MSHSWMPIYWGDYFRDTRHLTTEEHGAYLLLIGAYWARGAALPNNDSALAKMAGASHQKWKYLKRNLSEFFAISEASWRHERVEKELLRSSARSAAASANAQRRLSGGSATTTTSTLLESESPSRPESDSLKLSQPSNAAPLSNFNNSKNNIALAVQLAGELAESSGLDPTKVPAFAASSEILLWLDTGCDPDADIRPAVADVSATMKASGRAPPRSWRYFRNAVSERRDARLAGIPSKPVAGNGPQVDKEGRAEKFVREMSDKGLSVEDISRNLWLGLTRREISEILAR